MQGRKIIVFYYFEQMTFQAVRGPSYQGDIAIDDVSFVNGPCPPTSKK